MAPTFSVIIPVYNRSAMVRQAIDSALSQEIEDHEVIVVDDGSTDDTPVHLFRYGSRIRLLRQSNQGPEIARNEGARAARGTYLCFLDSDDLLLPWALRTYREVLDSTSQPALVLGRMAHFVSDSAYSVNPALRTPIEIAVYPDIISKDRSAAYSFSAFVVNKTALEKVGGFRRGTPQMFQGDDLDFMLRMATSGPAVLIRQPATVAYRQHAGNSLQDFQQLVEGFRINIEDDKKGLYPGGKLRRPGRHSLIGGCLGFWLLRSVKLGYYRKTLSLFAMGYPMIAAWLLRAIEIKIRGRMELVSLGTRTRTE